MHAEIIYAAFLPLPVAGFPFVFFTARVQASWWWR
jgi:hypothetical protein